MYTKLENFHKNIGGLKNVTPQAETNKVLRKRFRQC